MPRRFYGLTDREKQVAESLLDGCSNRQIGEHISMKERTVKAHLKKMFGFFGIDESRIQRVCLAVLLHNHRQDLGIRCRACGEING